MSSTNNNINTNVISKDSIHRLLKDVKDIIKHPLHDNGIYYQHDDEDMLKGYALIIGPTETPYFGGNYFFEFLYPYNYPYSPPKVKFCTGGEDVRFNPNLYTSGKVCLSILNTWTGDQWTSSQTITTILLNLCTLFCVNPLLNEPGINKFHPDLENYNKIIEYENMNIAIGDILLNELEDKSIKQSDTNVNSNNNSIKNMHYFSYLFKEVMIENFSKNIDNYIQFAEQKKLECTVPMLFKTGIYNLRILINYEKVIQKLLFLKINLLKK
jgi:ubiquitin-protein ligase